LQTLLEGQLLALIVEPVLLEFQQHLVKVRNLEVLVQDLKPGADSQGKNQL
jgi:hypothetical protein